MTEEKESLPLAQKVPERRQEEGDLGWGVERPQHH